ncbi:MAG: hypothetical protein ABFC88_13030 [Thermoguttaceae bacterium]
MAKRAVKKQSKSKESKPKPALKPAAEAKYPPPFEFHFRAGPYVAPKIAKGATVHDEYVGDVECIGITDAPIAWPAYAAKTGRRESPMPILTGALVRAVCEEEELVVAHYWGVTRHMVNRWKCAIAGATDSNEVAVNIALSKNTPAFRKQFGYDQ